MELGENIYRLRTEQRMSQGDLAEALDVSRQSVSKWETGSAVPELDKLVKMSKLFGVTLDELVNGTIPLPESEPAQSTTFEEKALPVTDIPSEEDMKPFSVSGQSVIIANQFHLIQAPLSVEHDTNSETLGEVLPLLPDPPQDQPNKAIDSEPRMFHNYTLHQMIGFAFLAIAFLLFLYHLLFSRHRPISETQVQIVLVLLLTFAGGLLVVPRA